MSFNTNIGDALTYTVSGTPSTDSYEATYSNTYSLCPVVCVLTDEFGNEMTNLAAYGLSFNPFIPLLSVQTADPSLN